MIKRAIGYCVELECEDFHKGVFLLNHLGHFRCERCKNIGMIEKETATHKNECNIYREVRIEFNYDPMLRAYRSVAIIRDDSLPESKTNIYTVKTPLVKVEKRALKIAENILATLNKIGFNSDSGDPDPVIRMSETIIDWDAPKDQYQLQMAELTKHLNRIAN